MTLMITLRDPVRDTLAFSTFAQGVAGGCLVLALASTLDYRRQRKAKLLFLFASFVLSAGLILFGSGPTRSAPKVNLLGFNLPRSFAFSSSSFLPDTLRNDGNFFARCAINAKDSKTLAVGGGAQARDPAAGTRRCGRLTRLLLSAERSWPGAADRVPVSRLYAVARDRYLFAFIGLIVILCGFASGYVLGFPQNVAGRVSMWLSPWDNSVRGGEQVAHSLWAFATGRGLRHGPRTRRSAVDACGSYRSNLWPRAGRGVGIPGCPWSACALMPPWFGLACVGAPCPLRLQLFLGRRADSGIRSPDRTDCGRCSSIQSLSPGLWFRFSATAEQVLSPTSRSSAFCSLSAGKFRLPTTYDGALSRERAGDFLRDRRARRLPAGEGVLHSGDPCMSATAGVGALALQADGERRYEYNPRLLVVVYSIPRLNHR